jgi:hypothetical protein
MVDLTADLTAEPLAFLMADSTADQKVSLTDT